MSADTDFDYFSCYLDLLGYQKNEISDSISKILNIRTTLQEEGLLLCTFSLPTNNHDFKMFLRKLCQYPLNLEQFTLDVGSDTLIRCKIIYDTCEILSKPLFRFSNRQFKNIDMLRMQLKGLTFTYKILKSHLFFQIMQFDGIGTNIQFHYNATKDCFATSPSGMDYAAFIAKNKDKITSIKMYNAALVPMPAAAPGQPGLSSAAQSSIVQSVTSPVPAAASLPAAATTDTPHRHLTFPIGSLRRNLHAETLEPELRSRHHSGGVTTRLASANKKIITEIAQSKGLVCDSDVVEEMFQNRSSWNITKYGILCLALQGIIPLSDKRFTLSDDEEEDQSQDTINKTMSEMIQEKDIPK